MRITWTLSATLWIAMMPLGGCISHRSKPVAPVTVTTENGSAFPAAMAGRWKSDRHGWQFSIEPDGRISWAVISFGRVKVLPGQTTTVATTTGDQAVFTPGPWLVHYDPATRMLTLKIGMSHIRMPIGSNIIEGSSTDVFTGVVSPEMNVWQAQWTAFTDYTAQTSEGKPLDLSTDKTYGETIPLVFTKVVDR